MFSVVADQLQQAVGIGLASIIDLLQILGVFFYCKGWFLVTLVGLVLDRTEPLSILAGRGILVAHLAALPRAGIVAAPIVPSTRDRKPGNLCSAQAQLRGDHGACLF